MTEKWTEQKVFELLPKLFPTEAYTLLSQVRGRTGSMEKGTRTADALVISNWPSRGLYMTGVEIKVSKSDWKKELASPEKSIAIQKYCKHWYMAAPKGLIPVGEVPMNWGLIEVTATACTITKAAPELEHEPVDMPLLASILRNVAEHMTPTSVVQEQIRKMVEETVETRIGRATTNLNSQIRTLHAKIDAFERSSGIDIGDGWNGGRIGEAVKYVLSGKHLQIDRHVAQVEEVARGLLTLIETLKEENRPENEEQTSTISLP